MTDTMIKAIAMTEIDITKMNEMSDKYNNNTLTDKQRASARKSMEVIDIKLAKRAKKFGEDFFDKYMCDLCCSYEEQLELLD